MFAFYSSFFAGFIISWVCLTREKGRAKMVVNFPRLASGSSLTRAFSLRRFFENLENRWINRGLPKIRGIFF